jgi:hypothetical protein
MRGKHHRAGGAQTLFLAGFLDKTRALGAAVRADTGRLGHALAIQRTTLCRQERGLQFVCLIFEVPANPPPQLFEQLIGRSIAEVK